MQRLRLFADDAKNEAAKSRAPCSACGSEQMQLLNGYAQLPDWIWRCRVCRAPTRPTDSWFAAFRKGNSQ